VSVSKALLLLGVLCGAAFHKLYILTAMPRPPAVHTLLAHAQCMCRKEAGWNYFNFIINHR